MGKRLGLLIILVFFSCLTLGFLTNRFLLQNYQAQSRFAQSPTPIPTLPNQRNLLLVVTDDLLSPTWRVYSLWAVILYFPQQQLIFQALTPPDNQHDLFETLHPDAHGTLPQEFLQKASHIYLPWQDYLILDREALTRLYLWASRQPQPTPGEEPGDEQALQALCNHISQSSNSLSTLTDSGILRPPHFRSSITLEIASEIQSKLSSLSSLKCNVYDH